MKIYNVEVDVSIKKRALDMLFLHFNPNNPYQALLWGEIKGLICKFWS